jgi:hypothetical protein
VAAGIAAAHPVDDLDRVAAELTDLRAVEADLDADDPIGDVYHEATGLLARQLRDAARKRPAPASPEDGPRYGETADDEPAVYSAPWAGPVVDAWKATPTPAAEPGPAALRLRRTRRLPGSADETAVRAVHRDPAGHHVVVLPRNADVADPWFHAEWPVSTAAAAAWTDRTVLAADDGEAGATTLLALTPAGRRRGDARRPGADAAATPRRRLRPRLRRRHPRRRLPCPPALRPRRRPRAGRHPPLPRRRTPHRRRPGQPTVGRRLHDQRPPRLSWPQVQLWARGDRKTARACSSPPTIGGGAAG